MYAARGRRAVLGERAGDLDARNLQLVSGALLQGSLILAIGATVMAIQPAPIGTATATAALVWLIIAFLWKFALALVPEDIGEILLKHMIPFTHFFYYLFWPVLFPLRQMFARLDGTVRMAAAGLLTLITMPSNSIRSKKHM